MNDLEIKQNSSTDQKDAKLKSFIERIERLEEEKNNITLDKDSINAPCNFVNYYFPE